MTLNQIWTKLEDEEPLTTAENKAFEEEVEQGIDELEKALAAK